MIIIEDPDTLGKVCGANDRNLKQLEKLLACKIYTRGNEIHLSSASSEKYNIFESILNDLLFSVKRKRLPDAYMIDTLYHAFGDEQSSQGSMDFLENELNIPGGKGIIRARNLNQARYISQMNSHDLCFGVGPAGTGKTFLAIAFALNEVLNRRYRKLIISRPVVEAGESLGFLPGDMTQKLDPPQTSV